MDKPKPQYPPKVQKALKASKFLHRWWSRRREKAKAQQTQPKRDTDSGEMTRSPFLIDDRLHEGGAYLVPIRGRDASKKESSEN